MSLRFGRKRSGSGFGVRVEGGRISTVRAFECGYRDAFLGSNRLKDFPTNAFYGQVTLLLSWRARKLASFPRVFVFRSDFL